MAKIKCDNCCNVFEFAPEDIKQSIVKLDGGYSDVCFLVCPVCSSHFILAVHDSKWHEMKEDLDRAKQRYRSYFGSGLNVRLDNALEAIKKKKEKLSIYTDKIVAEAKSKTELSVVNGCIILINKKDESSDLAGD